MNSLKKGEGVPLSNFEGGNEFLFLNFERGPGVPRLNSRGSRVPGPGVLVPLLYHAYFSNQAVYLHDQKVKTKI